MTDSLTPQKKRTIVAHDKHDERHFGAVNVPVYQNSLFTFPDMDHFTTAMSDLRNHHVYTRGNNPTVNELEKKLARLEGGEAAKCFASGMAAITAAIMSVIRSGDHIICVDQAYGPAREFMGQYLRKFSITTSFVDGTSVDNIRAAVQPNTRLIYLESPSSMYFQLQDIGACAKLAKDIGAFTIIDNSWATPYYQNPLLMGVDMVVHSMSKYISGHSDAVGGVVVGSDACMEKLILNEYMLFGGIMSAQIAALVMRGLRTLPVRMERHHQTGLQVAEYLQSLPFVVKVNHPGLPEHPQHELAIRQMNGFGSLFSFEADLPLETMKRWIKELRLFRIGVSWGGYESLVLINQDHPSKVLVRMYAGLEDADDIIADISSAFAKIGVAG